MRIIPVRCLFIFIFISFLVIVANGQVVKEEVIISLGKYEPSENGYVLNNLKIPVEINSIHSGTKQATIGTRASIKSYSIEGYKYNGKIYYKNSEIFSGKIKESFSNSYCNFNIVYQLYYKETLQNTYNGKVNINYTFTSESLSKQNSSASDFSIRNVRVFSTKCTVMERHIQEAINILEQKNSKSNSEISSQEANSNSSKNNRNNNKETISSKASDLYSGRLTDINDPSEGKSSSTSADNNSETANRNRQLQRELKENYDKSVEEAQNSAKEFNNLINDYAENQQKRAESKERFKEKLREDARRGRDIEAQNKNIFLSRHDDMETSKRDFKKLVSGIVKRNNNLYFLYDYFNNSYLEDGNQIFIVSIDIYKAIPNLSYWNDRYTYMLRDWEKNNKFSVNVTLSSQPLSIYVNATTREKYSVLQQTKKETDNIVIVSNSKDELIKILKTLQSLSSNNYLKLNNNDDANKALKRRMGNYANSMMSGAKAEKSELYKKGILHYSLAGRETRKDEQDKGLKTAIHFFDIAAKEGHPKAMRILRDFPEFNNIFNAFKEADHESIKFLFQEKIVNCHTKFLIKKISKAKSYGDRDYVYYNNIDPLLASLYSQDSTLINYVLKQGCDINKINRSENKHGTPLHFALRQGLYKSAYFLLERGAETSIEDFDKHTSLSLAISYIGNSERVGDDYSQICKWLIHNLIAYGANPDQRLEKAGYYVLHYAAQFNSTEAAEKLLELGANSNVVDENDKRTPLYYAIASGNYKMAQILLQNGASVDIKDNYNISPYKYAKKMKQKSIAKLIKGYKPEASESERNGDSNNNNSSTFGMAEKMPEFPGGRNALSLFLNDNIKYPEEAVTNKIEGKVLVQFIVSSTGELKDIKLLKSVHPALDQEALRVIKLMPRWIPGEQRGKAINARQVLPINFAL
ncbi:MAG: TonB family protein [Candidatus Cyclobacteriaceae bacterium M2_1C_046]